MRSSVLAEEALSRGFECIFVGKINDLKWLTAHINGLGFSQVFENELDFKSNPKTDILIVDSYQIDTESNFIQNKNWLTTLSIEDGHSPNYKTKLKVIPNLSVRKNTDLETRFFSGPDYLLIRKTINKKKFNPKLNRSLNILVSGGGSDPYGFVSEIARNLDNINVDFEANFLSNNKVISETGKKFYNWEIGSVIETLAAKADLVLTTASTSSFEFLAREIPMGHACVVENQEEIYKELSNIGVSVPIGFRDDSGWHLDFEKIELLIRSETLRSSLHEKICGLVDLKGAKRIVDLLEGIANKSSNP